MDVKVSVEHKQTGLNFILHVTDMFYSPGCSGTGPTYSCGGTPPEPAEAYPTEGWVELDGEVHEIVDITSDDMDVIMLMTNDNAALFDELFDADEDGEQKVYEALVEYKENEMYEEMRARYGDDSF